MLSLARLTAASKHYKRMPHVDSFERYFWDRCTVSEAYRLLVRTRSKKIYWS